MEEEKLTKRERRALAKEEKREAREQRERMSKIRNWVIGLLLFAGLLFAGYKAWMWINTPAPEVAEIVQVNDNDWYKGEREASVTLVEYSDFACPACANYFPIVKRLTDELGENVRFVYRHFPTASANDRTHSSFRAGEAAGRQGKFWEMHDILFEKQEEWSKDNSPEDKFESYAQEIGLDVDKYKGDYESEEVKAKIEADILSGRQLAVSATPTFFLNGRRIQNPRGYDAFKSTLEDEIRGYSLE